MNIGFDAKRLFRNFTGLGNYSRTLLRNLSAFQPEHHYHLFTPDADQNDANADFFESTHYKIHQCTSRIKFYWRSIGIVKDLANANIEIYHGLSNEIPFNIKKAGIKSVVSIHDLIFKVYPETYGLSERMVYDKKFRYACKHADRIIAISEHTKKDIQRYYGIEAAKIEVIYQACHPDFYVLKTAEENKNVLLQYNLPEKYFLFVGSVEARKNLKLIIEAYRKHKSQLRHPILIVGKGKQYQTECKQLIAQYKLEDYFIWQDRLSNNHHLQSIYQCAIALIYPSLYEGFGLPIAEALLCKVPVIAANTSSLKEAGGPNSIYIDPNKPTVLANAMQLLLSDQQLRVQMQESGHAYALNQFDPKRLSAQLTMLYKNVLQGKKI